MPHLVSKSRRFASTLTLVVAVVVAVLSAGCNVAQDAERAQSVISAVLQIAQAEEPALPPADAAILAQWVHLGITLNAQLTTCVSAAASNGNKKSAFLACFNSFSQGLLQPAELAQLRVLSPASERKVQLYVTAIAVGLNVAIPLLGGTPEPAPAISAVQPSPQELAAFAHRIGAPAPGF